ncbi:MAG TPA: RecQ family zinc-binding domain-containing protein, partial [Thermoanaerobaculia bacterium]|nr:RecQ family zinc-binding domain-containing protein [Thermoanaerobaculia bacterium]
LREGEALDARDIAERLGLSRAKVNTALIGLEDLGSIERLPTGTVRRAAGKADPVAAADEAAELDVRRRQAVLSRIEVMRHYAELGTCRRQFLLNYFGEETEGACERCDNCEGARRPAAAPLEADAEKRPFPLESWVVHPEFGKGVVESYRGDRVVVLFEREGSRTISLTAAQADGLLRPFETGS